MDAKLKLQGILYIMHTVEKDLTDLMNVYHDHRGSLEDSATFAGDIITNVEGHLKDLREGKE